ncbi:hypothetical protein Tco_0549019, partial [Tanacetum coccineum]
MDGALTCKVASVTYDWRALYVIAPCALIYDRVVANLQAELSYFRSHLATLEVQPPPPPPQVPPSTAAFSIADLPITTSSLPTIYDLSVLFDPMIQSSAWSMQQSSRLM